MTARIEHANLTVRDPDATARTLCTLFGWHIRWEGPAGDDGYTVHVGDDTGYLALYRPGGDAAAGSAQRYTAWGGLNHLGVVVDDLDATAERVRAAGYRVNGATDYDPGRRFYFYGPEDVEFEVVSYD